MFRAFRIKDIRRRFYYMFFFMIVIRLGAQIPCPGISAQYFAEWFRENTGSAFNLLDAFTGGSFERMSVLALSITPYITASIIIELLTIAIPALEEMHKDGEFGRKKLIAITRLATVTLSVLESTAMCIGFGRQGLIPNMTFVKGLTVVFAMTAGSCFLMWAGEQLTIHGVGNGISIVLVINILSGMPRNITALYERFVKGSTIAKGGVAVIVILTVILALMASVVILNGAVRKIPLQYSRKMGKNSASNLPLKVNTAGVIPVIFASSVMSMPSLIAAIAGKQPAWLNFLSENSWFDPTRPVYTAGVVLYIGLVVFFAYFYTSITFSPMEVADNLRKQGSTIPGIRPGKPTERYLVSILNPVVFIGAVMLSGIAIFPFIFNGLFRAGVSFGGTSVIIIVSVILETVKQVEAMMAVHNYQGFLA